ncbi:MAG: hypothetical protein J2P54_07250, partial [Bradyrhizobiaceae bacterium]|nr:hypothetical protein [Bradyrhizobiaceae bacterium]
MSVPSCAGPDPAHSGLGRALDWGEERLSPFFFKAEQRPPVGARQLALALLHFRNSSNSWFRSPSLS